MSELRALVDIIYAELPAVRTAFACEIGLAVLVPNQRLSCTRAQKKADFKAFYIFAYEYSKEDGQKVVAIETALALWRMLLREQYEMSEKWCQSGTCPFLPLVCLGRPAPSPSDPSESFK
jgi:hypothetical protein